MHVVDVLLPLGEDVVPVKRVRLGTKTVTEHETINRDRPARREIEAEGVGVPGVLAVPIVTDKAMSTVIPRMITTVVMAVPGGG